MSVGFEQVTVSLCCSQCRIEDDIKMGCKTWDQSQGMRDHPWRTSHCWLLVADSYSCAGTPESKHLTSVTMHRAGYRHGMSGGCTSQAFRKSCGNWTVPASTVMAAAQKRQQQHEMHHYCYVLDATISLQGGHFCPGRRESFRKCWWQRSSLPWSLLTGSS